MVRSRFPGRPTKYINRIRINVLPASTFGVSSVCMTVDSDEISKKNEHPFVNGENEVVNIDNSCNLKVSTLNKRHKTLAKRRTQHKRNVLLNTSAKTTNPNLVNHVSGRNKANLKSRRSVRKFSTLRKVGRYSTAFCDKNNIVGKFVLPSRSVHSSRVIKPNKRFINIESSDNRTFRKNILPKKQNLKCSEVKIKLKPFKATENVASEDAQSSCLKTRPLLREARLQIKTKNTLSSKGPFSLTTNVGTGYITCGVCGAFSFNHLLKQVKKFNIYSCKSCRQFISKMIKRQKCKKVNSILTCHNGQGRCMVSPVYSTSPNRTNRTKCPACWLKMCLRSFQLPTSLHNNLVQLLPPFMNERDQLFSGTTFPLQPWPLNIENKTTGIDNKQDNVLKQPLVESSELSTIRPVRFKAAKEETKLSEVSNSRGLKRQKVDLKGPRVKHVCRSASIVLGQPLATFSSSNALKTDQEAVVVSDTKENFENDDKNEETDDEKNSIAEYTETQCTGKPMVFQQNIKCDRTVKLPVTSETKSGQVQKKVSNKTGINIDFWESYDAEEISKNGFCIIGSEPLPMLPICFLCGSGGREPLLHCSLCCEPYHAFCLEQVPQQITNNRFNWLCPRCTKCSACGQNDRQKINCQKCHKDYHPECFNDKWKMSDRPLVCSTCLRCKSCGTSNIIKFSGNIPLCLNCFKLRKKGNFCPLCQKCYEENDVESKMMECTKCKKWVHAQCENLTDEQYQILSILPESQGYQCNICCTDSVKTWRQAIQQELRSCFNIVLRLFSKNRTARNLIKWSPLKYTPSEKSLGLGFARRLQFNEENVDVNVTERNQSSGDVQRKVIFKKDAGVIQNEVNKVPLSPAMIEIKNKLNSFEYMTLKDFNNSMKKALESPEHKEILDVYYSILKKVFPWFDPNNQESDSLNDEKEKTDNETCIQIFSDIDIPSKHISNIKINDTRICILCKGVGDGLSHQESRLLYCGHNEWIHANCALWSSEVYEEIDGSLQNVWSAIARGRSMRCARCKHRGASVGCCLKGCYETYHFRCAQQAKCYFLHDKNVYCNSHTIENKVNVITLPNEFHINRSVYIELDRKKKKYFEPEKIHFMVGSLVVSNLGKIVPVLSDSPQFILPAGFTCSRLFWSTVEPWKIIPYLITTSISNTNSISTTTDKNFTVDHNLPKPVLDKKLKELSIWLKDIGKSEFDEDIEEQNVDILPAELMNDDIFEVLQHDLLDEISVQDMLMSYEELLNMDFKNSEINCNDTLINNENFKKSEDEEGEFEQSKSTREMKKNKTDMFSQITELSKARNQQRSCSLTFSCKMDNNINPVIKKRKINHVNRDNNMFLQLLQVDGAADSSESECGSPVHEIEHKWTLVENSEEPVTCEKCQCTYRTAASYKRHLENCDALFTSESDSEEHISTNVDNVYAKPIEQNLMDNSSIIVKIEEKEPQTITSYESYSTYTTQSHVHSTILNSHSTFVASESTNEVANIPENQAIYYPSYQSDLQQKHVAAQPVPVPLNSTATITINQNTTDCRTYTAASATASIPLNQNNAALCVNSAPLCVDSISNIISLDNNQSMTMNQQISIPTGGLAINQPIDLQNQHVTIQQVPFTPEVTPVLNITTQNSNVPNICNSLSTQSAIPQNQWVKSIIKPTLISQKTIRPKAKGRGMATKQATGKFTNGTAIIFPQNNSTNASVIFQHLQTNMVPTFIDQFQQQNAQNVQYVASISPQINQPQLVQLQPENNFLSIVPGVQPTMIIQQPPRLISDQLIVDSNSSMIWTTPPIQPIYYGFETIVQNTVMQSQQFLPSTVPGVLTTNSSYSATTQVFQASKLEPVLDVSSGSFVLVNNCSGQILNPQTIPSVQNPQTTTQNFSTATVLQNKPNVWKILESPVNNESQMLTGQLQIKPQVSKPQSTNSITLPVAPFVPEQGIPTNIVTPTPKQNNTTQQQVRPTNRVLPMQTITMKELKKSTNNIDKKVDSFVDDKTKFVKMEKQKVHILHDLNLKSTDIIKFDKEVKLVEPIKPIQLKPNNDFNFVSKQTDSNNDLIEQTICHVSKPITKEECISNDELKKQDDEAKNKMITISNCEIKPKINILQNDTSIIEKNTLEQNPPELKEEIYINKELVDKDSDMKTFSENLCTDSNMKSKCNINSNEIKKNKEKEKIKNVIEETNKNIKQKSNDFKSNKTNQSSHPSILYTVETQEGFKYSSTSLTDLWEKVFETVQNARIGHNMTPLPPSSLEIINNMQLLGLKTNGLKYLIEQLPGASSCTKYKPVFHIPVLEENLDNYEHSGGAIRCVIHEFKKEEHVDMFGWLSSKHRNLENFIVDSDVMPRRGTMTNLPMAMRFRQLKTMSKISVGVYRSGIHGRGLFALRNFESGEMVIEYSGEVIRSILTDKREKYYNSKGIGCYMFRIDDNLVIDATMKGNAARFINHSCDPNCYSKVVEIHGHKHIIIFALRRIICQEELTYDYKFPFEEDKIPCTCGSKRCRKFLN